MAGSRRADAWCLAVLLLEAVLVLGDLLLDPDRVVSHPFGDTFRFFYPSRAFGYGELASGNLPLWNPHLFSGQPYLGGFQAAILYPLNLVHLVLPTGSAIDVEVFIHTVLVCVGAYLWARFRGVSPVGSLVTANVIGFGGTYALRVFAGELSVVAVLAWVPWVLLAVDRILSRASLGWTLVGVGAVTMQILAGYPALVLRTGLAAGILVASWLVTMARVGRDGAAGFAGVGKTLGCLAAVAVAPLFLSAAQLWPGLATASESVRADGVPYAWATQLSFPPESLITLVAPAFFGDLASFPYWGRGFFWDASLFCGVAGTVLAVLGALTPGRGRLEPLVFAVVFALLAMGSHTPLNRVLFDFVPGFAAVRAPSQFAFFAAVGIALLAGRGMDRWMRGEVPWLLGVVSASSGFAVVGAAAWLAWTSGGQAWPGEFSAAIESDPDTWYRLDPELAEAAATNAAAGLLWVGVTLCAVAGAVLLRNRPAVSVALVVLVAAELVVFARGHRGGFALEERQRPTADAIYREGKADERVFDLGRTSRGGPNRAMELGGRGAWGYDPVLLKRYGEFMASLQPLVLPPWLLITPFPPRALHPLLSMVGVGPVLEPETPDASTGRKPVASRQLQLPPSTDRVRRLGGERALPRFHAVGQYRLRPDPGGALAEIHREGFDPWTEVVLEAEPEVEPVGGVPQSKVNVVSESTDHVDVDASVDRNALLVWADSYSDGWVATSRTDPAASYPVLPANHALKAVALAAGDHQLRFEYRPAAFSVGRWVSLVSLVVYLVAVGSALVVWRRSST